MGPRWCWGVTSLFRGLCTPGLPTHSRNADIHSSIPCSFLSFRMFKTCLAPIGVGAAMDIELVGFVTHPCGGINAQRQPGSMVGDGEQLSHSRHWCEESPEASFPLIPGARVVEPVGNSRESLGWSTGKWRPIKATLAWPWAHTGDQHHLWWSGDAGQSSLRLFPGGRRRGWRGWWSLRRSTLQT